MFYSSNQVESPSASNQKESTLTFIENFIMWSQVAKSATKGNKKLKSSNQVAQSATKGNKKLKISNQVA